MPLVDRLRAHGAKGPRKEPLWVGPCGQGPQGGVSFSLLSRWLTCKERFRLLVVEGLTPAPVFSPAMDYGSMWHVCEEQYAGGGNWQAALTQYCRDNLCKRFPTQQQQISHWYEMCRAQFPLYIEYWSKHPDESKITPIAQEDRFDVPYKLSSGRVVRLRGKRDSVYQLRGQNWLMENKTKSQIDQQKLTRQLTFDLQTMMYLVASMEYKPVGVRYNVVRRSAHKTPQSMVTKIMEDAENGRISEWFARWDTKINKKDIDTFKYQCLTPILETLCNWWDSIGGNNSLPYTAYHWRHPFGVRNIIDEGGATDLDYMLTTGSRVGLVQATTLFSELEEA